MVREKVNGEKERVTLQLRSLKGKTMAKSVKRKKKDMGKLKRSEEKERERERSDL